MYCLWLNGKKVYTLQQLRASFDAEAVGLYCLGGGLVRWLRDCGEQDIAEKVEQIDLSQSVSRQLADIFGVDLPETGEQICLPEAAPVQAVPAAGDSFTAPLSFFPDTSFAPSSFFTSFDTTSFNFSAAYTSFFTTSFLTTSFGGEYKYEYESGSFAASSFSLYLSSFSAETAFSAGSFILGSFTFGSFTLGSFAFGSFSPGYGSFPLVLSSFSPKSLEAPSAADLTLKNDPAPLTPRQKFELNLSSNPLNRYGYGIHLI